MNADDSKILIHINSYENIKNMDKYEIIKNVVYYPDDRNDILLYYNFDEDKWEEVSMIENDLKELNETKDSIQNGIYNALYMIINHDDIFCKYLTFYTELKVFQFYLNDMIQSVVYNKNHNGTKSINLQKFYKNYTDKELFIKVDQCSFSVTISTWHIDDLVSIYCISISAIVDHNFDKESNIINKYSHQFDFMIQDDKLDHYTYIRKHLT